jgi:hypothetical protein
VASPGDNPTLRRWVASIPPAGLTIYECDS